MLKRLIKLFTCTSECKFNAKRDCPQEMFSLPWYLDDFELKDKDLKRLFKIYSKRKKELCCAKPMACETIV